MRQMVSIFKITAKDIESLSDVDARELIARLSREDARKSGFSQSVVTWGGDQKAADGGVDVKFNANAPVAPDAYIPKGITNIQVKAEQFGPAKVTEEMQPKGAIREFFEELANNGGAYIVAATRDGVSDVFLKKRVAAMEAVLKNNGLAGKVYVDFFGSRRIADWVESNPAIAIWVRSKLGKPLSGWRPYGPWAYRETDIEAPYLMDDDVRVYPPKAVDGQSITEAITSLRDALLSNKAIRVIGLSGVGKTRLVQALFDSRISGGTTPSSNNVIYADLAEALSPTPDDILRQLIADKAEAIIVLDNCSPSAHSKFTEILSGHSDKIKLITIEYDIKEESAEDTSFYRVEGVSDKIIRKLVQSKYRDIHRPDAERIADFSNGNVRLAFALASSYEGAGSFSQLTDNDLFDRLFRQKNIEDKTLRKVAEVASLFYSFDAQSFGSGSEMSVLASLSEETELSCSRHVSELQSRGMAQERGVWKALLPHAIANRLAFFALENTPILVLKNEILSSGNNRLIKSFTRRLGYLHNSLKAKSLAADFLSTTGLLGNIVNMSYDEVAMFSNIAPIDENETLSALNRASGNNSFISIENGHRQKFIQIARALAYEPENFIPSLNVLKRFAKAEPTGYSNNSAIPEITSLFMPQYSGSNAPRDMRIDEVRAMLQSADSKEVSLGLESLKAALGSERYDVPFHYEFGARKRGYGKSLEPHQTWGDWYLPWLSLAEEFAIQNTDNGKEVRTMLAECFNTLWFRVNLYEELEALAGKFKTIDGWSKGWIATRQCLEWNKKEMGDEIKERLKSLSNFLRPTDLKGQIQARVLMKGDFCHELDELDDDLPAKGSERRAVSVLDAKDLGQQVCENPQLLMEILPDCLGKDFGGKIFPFGIAIGEYYSDIPALLQVIQREADAMDVGDISMQFLRGLLSGWHSKNAQAVETFISNALNDNFWKRWFIEILIVKPLDETSVLQLLSYADDEDAWISSFQWLGSGRLTSTLSIEQIERLILKLSSKGQEGAIVALDILHMVIFCSREFDENYRQELGEMLLRYLEVVNWDHIRREHRGDERNFNDVVTMALRSRPKEKKVEELLVSVLEREKKSGRYHVGTLGRSLKPFFKEFPKVSLDTLYSPVDEGESNSAVRLVTNGLLSGAKTALFEVPDDILTQWVQVSPLDRCLFAADTCKLYDFEDEEKKIMEPTDIARSILAIAENKQAILSKYKSRLQHSNRGGYRSSNIADIIPVFEKFSDGADDVVTKIVSDLSLELRKIVQELQERERVEETQENLSFE